MTDELPFYQVVLAYPPFADWGEQRTLNIPVWRCIDQSKCVLALVVPIADVAKGFAALSLWGFAFRNCTLKGKHLILVGTVGSPEVPGIGNKRLIGTFQHVGSPRLLLNPPGRVDRRHHGGWDLWTPFGWHQVDLYAYPIRQSFGALDLLALDSAQEFRRVFNVGRTWRFALGDAMLRMLESRPGMTRSEVIRWVQTAIGKQIAYSQLAAMLRLAEEVPPSQRDPSISWGDYYAAAIRQPQKGTIDV